MPAANDNSSEIAWSHVKLTAGTVTAGTIETMEGVRALPAAVGMEARDDFDISPPVRDLVLGDH